MQLCHFVSGDRSVYVLTTVVCSLHMCESSPLGWSYFSEWSKELSVLVHVSFGITRK